MIPHNDTGVDGACQYLTMQTLVSNELSAHSSTTDARTAFQCRRIKHVDEVLKLHCKSQSQVSHTQRCLLRLTSRQNLSSLAAHAILHHIVSPSPSQVDLE
jgi:hypothetical protein